MPEQLPLQPSTPRERAAQAAYAAGTSCTPIPAGCRHRDCAAARVELARALEIAIEEGC
jgi:hypothetical protein